MTKQFIFIILIGFTFSFKSKKNEIKIPKGTLDVALSNIRNTNGFIYIFIYSYANQYPYEPYKHYKVKKHNVKNGLLTARISELNLKNEYAITLIDDENANKDLDRWLGIPHEGYGFSNNIKPFLSLPDYEDLIFDFSSSKKLNIKVQYVL